MTYDVERPAFWYGIPYGYAQLDLHPSLDRIEALVEQVLSLPEEMRERAAEVLQFYAGTVTLLNSERVQGCAIGVHPDDQGGYAFSVLTVAGVSSAGADPKLVLANMVGTADRSRPGEGVRPLALPSGTGLLAEERRRSPAPGTGSQETVWQGTIAVPDADSAEIILVQLVTAAVDRADDYLRVLIGVAHTVTFTDPTSADDSDNGVANAMRSDFG
ncbi:hypothetical protein [Streptomyces sp. NPDC050738]|uniref:hypothetical protein n=1 Tax=Streptomyces sp. NPDC050738 TaxID=3154744 RepID=UPI00343AE389